MLYAFDSSRNCVVFAYPNICKRTKIEKGCIKKDDQIEFQYGKKAYIQVKVISVKKSGIFRDKDIPIILKGITEKECVIVFKSITKYKDLSGVKVVVHRN